MLLSVATRSKQIRRTGVRCVSQLTPRNRLSQMFIPTSKEKVAASNADAVASHSLMLKSGFIRQSSSGIYSILPIGLRTIEKIEKVIDEEMRAIGGQKLALPLVLSSEMWKKTGRWDGMGSELFKLQDRKESDLLLAPTHEEEITQIVANELSSYRQLPIRLYQIGRKYRDEMRPRSGLLRGREFMMKDLYTFDESLETASVAYDDVQGAYNKIFRRIGVPFAVAEADTGNIGGSRSHEYHILSAAGEDNLLTCYKCNYTANEEKATGVLPETHEAALKAQSTTTPAGDNFLQLLNPSSAHSLGVQFATIKASLVDKHGKRTILEDNALVAAVSSSSREVNFLKVYEVIRKHMESKVAPDQQFVRSEISLTPSVPDTISSSQSVHLIIDESAEEGIEANEDTLQNAMKKLSCKDIIVHPKGDYRVAHEGDFCPSCHTDNVSSKLITEKAIEIGHTFLLGTKYSDALDCSFTPREPANAPKLPAQMGCYGIGVSRLSAAVIESLHDDAGMIWPTSIAPYRACILVADNKNPESNDIAEKLYDELNAQVSINDPLCNEVVLDDRKGGFGFKIRDAEMIGYPFVVIVGNKTRTNGMVEIRERIKGQKSHQIELPITEAVAHLKQRVAEKLAV
ncbi:hypothetical protein K450DRAFT_239730 [Umbelopsis ramanniana AG]|uniref:proline--tRNA ligase n=1 Tax=Umbelopsis ramanniana AG TaxID=1314678 RepID=A0AAD5EAZ1_UMBRA|nr:uncharacterized protein K450DRAFT_239730 [Umbelopsis ramanniana AG]KAI8579919.1 hypothetical protein K450DRAFT_239730 [Umbelopsis ramanniana AG]